MKREDIKDERLQAVFDLCVHLRKKTAEYLLDYHNEIPSWKKTKESK